MSSTWLGHRSGWIGGDGDPQLVMWDLAWAPFALSHLHSPLVTNYLVYPAQINLMWNTSDILPSLALWPVTAVFGPITGYNLLTTLTPALSAWCAFLALLRYSRWPGALAGGLVYGFSPYVMAQLGGHPHSSFALFPPLALLALDEILVRQRRPLLAGALLGVAFSAQLLTGLELLAATVLIGAIAAALLVLLHPRAASARAPVALKGLGAAAVTAIPLSAYPLYVLLFGPNRGSGAIQPLDTYVTDLLGLVVPSAGQYFHTAAALAVQARFTGNAAEQDAYLGIPLIAFLLITTVALWRRPLIRWSILVLLAALVLSFGPHLHIGGRVTGVSLPWALVQKISYYQAAIPARLGVFVFLMVAIIVTVAVDALLSAPHRGLAAAGLLATTLALLPLLPAGSLGSTDPENPPFFTTDLVRRVPDGSVALVMPYAPDPRDTIRAHLWQAESGFRYRMPEGEAIRPPTAGGPAFVDLQALQAQLDSTGYRITDAGELARLRSDLSTLQVRTVLVGPSAAQLAEVKLFEAVLGRPPELVGGVYVFTTGF